MIGYLNGKFISKSPAMVYVDVHGVGYEVHISLHTYSRIQDLDQGILYTCLLIREDAHLLFGFFDKFEKDVFLQLLSVSGIGASTARMMLSCMKPEEIVSAIINGDTRLLETVKGIGRKTAERMVLELKDRLAKNIQESNNSPLKHNTLYTDSLNALMALGIPRSGAEQAIKQAIKSSPSINTIEDLIKQALKLI